MRILLYGLCACVVATDAIGAAVHVENSEFVCCKSKLTSIQFDFYAAQLVAREVVQSYIC